MPYPSTFSPRPSRVWWDYQGIVYCELLKPGEIVGAITYRLFTRFGPFQLPLVFVDGKMYS